MRTPIDLRSDTVTRPTPAMLEAMARSPLGDDVLGDDPTVLELQREVAEMLGKPAACFVPSGTMANQAALRAHTEPGDEVLCHDNSHIIHYEAGGPAALSGLMIRPLPGPRGFFTPDDLDAALRPDSPNFARSRLVVLENTNNRGGGSVWPIDRLHAVCQRARHHNLRLHLDGARLWNASAATGIPPRDYAQPFDTISVCFSKGLGAPVGSAVVGDPESIRRVFRARKLFGGAMRQAGLLAGACLHALRHHRDRLSEDHANALRLAQALALIPGLRIDLANVETNMVFIDLDPSLALDAPGFCDRWAAAGVLALPTAPRRVRCVTHLDVDAAMIDHAAHAAALIIQR